VVERMKAQVFYEAEKMLLEEMPVPPVTETDVLVKVKNVGICGSDISYYYGLSPLGTPTGKGPLILGHEFTGEIVKVGKVPRQLGLFAQGDRVVVNPVQNCNACYACAAGQTHLCENINVPGVSTNGAFAEFCLSKYTGLFKLPDNVSYAAGAFTEPLACVVYGMKKLGVEPGQFVAIFGPGPMGQMMVQMARSIGAGKIALIGTRDYRLQIGKKFGADYIFNTSDKQSKYYVENLKEAIDVIRVPALSFHTMDKEIRSSWLAPLSWPTAIRSIAEGLVSVEAMVTHTYPLEEVEKAMINLRNRTNNPMKVQITP